MARLTVGTEHDAPGQTPVELHYEDAGAGRPVVLIHGWPLSGRAWEMQVPALVDAGYRVITYDRRGFGESSQPEGGYEYDTFAADLDAVMSQLDLTDATLVGFSMGGGEVVRYLKNHGGDRVRSVVLAAAVPPYLYKSEDNPDGGLDDATIEQFESGVRDDRPAFLKGFVEMFFAAGDKGDLVSQATKDDAFRIASGASPKGTLDCIAAFGRTDFRQDVAAVTVPTLVLHGDSDGIVPLQVSGQRSAESIPGAQLHVIAGGPHGVNASHTEEFNAALLAFLQR